MCQALLPRLGGSGRVAATEVMIPTPAIRNLIREDKIHQLYSVMQSGQEKIGMQTMNQSLATLVKQRRISMEAALAASSMEDELRDIVQRGAGVVAGAGMTRPVSRPLVPGAIAGWCTNRESESQDQSLYEGTDDAEFRLFGQDPRWSAG